MKIKVRQWLTKSCDFHKDLNKGGFVPFRTMFGEVLKEKGKLIYVKLQGGAEPSNECLHCGRKITHPVSLMYGIGPQCGGHYHISPVSEDELENYIDEIRKKLSRVTWEGWLPKNHVTIIPQKLFEIKFLFNGKVYNVKTTDFSKVEKIKDRSEKYEESITYV